MQKQKYKAKKIDTPVGVFDSKKEYSRYIELKALEDRGEIQDLQRQVPYELIPKQTIDGKCIERPCKYIADFTYIYNGSLIVEDVKGYRKGTAYNVFAIKRKLMLYIHNIKVKEV